MVRMYGMGLDVEVTLHGIVTAKGCTDDIRCIVIEKVLLDDGDAGQRIHVEIIDGNDKRVGGGRTDPLGGDKRPATGRRAKIDDPVSR